jgi:hypothetical protein
MIIFAVVGALLIGAGLTVGVAGLIAYLMMEQNEL